MNKNELWSYVEHEINMLRYYGYREDRKNLDINDVSLYDQIRSIGYAKVKTPLDLRCAGYICFKYEDGMSIEDLVSLNQLRSQKNGTFSPLEVWIFMFPEDRKFIYEEINTY